jgi:hypothetical protein
MILPQCRTIGRQTDEQILSLISLSILDMVFKFCSEFIVAFLFSSLKMFDILSGYLDDAEVYVYSNLVLIIFS